MFKLARIEKFNPIERFSDWFWNMNAVNAFTNSLFLLIGMSCVFVPNLAYVVWSNYIIFGWVIGELFYLGYWKDRTRKRSEKECLQRENTKLKREIRVQKNMLTHKMNTIEELMYANAKLKQGIS